MVGRCSVMIEGTFWLYGCGRWVNGEDLEEEVGVVDEILGMLNIFEWREDKNCG